MKLFWSSLELGHCFNFFKMFFQKCARSTWVFPTFFPLVGIHIFEPSHNLFQLFLLPILPLPSVGLFVSVFNSVCHRSICTSVCWNIDMETGIFLPCIIFECLCRRTKIFVFLFFQRRSNVEVTNCR